MLMLEKPYTHAHQPPNNAGASFAPFATPFTAATSCSSHQRHCSSHCCCQRRCSSRSHWHRCCSHFSCWFHCSSRSSSKGHWVVILASQFKIHRISIEVWKTVKNGFLKTTQLFLRKSWSVSCSQRSTFLHDILSEKYIPGQPAG